MCFVWLWFLGVKLWNLIYVCMGEQYGNCYVMERIVFWIGFQKDCGVFEYFLDECVVVGCCGQGKSQYGFGEGVEEIDVVFCVEVQVFVFFKFFVEGDWDFVGEGFVEFIEMVSFKGWVCCWCGQFIQGLYVDWLIVVFVSFWVDVIVGDKV